MKAPNYEKTKNFSQEKAYLVPNAELRGIGIPYATASDYFDASRLMDPTVVAGDSLSILSIPSPIVGKYIHLPDGNVSGPGLAWQGEVTTGLYRIGTANVGQSVLGALKWDWNATRMKFASGFSLGINTEPSVPLHVLNTSTQFQLSYDATHSTTFYTTSQHVLEVANSQGTLNLIASAAPTDYASFSVGGGPLYVTSTDRLFILTDRGENDGTAVITRIYNTDSGDPNAHAISELQVDPDVSGDPYIRFRVDNLSRYWSVGLDNSDSETFKVCLSSTLDTTNDKFGITTGGLMYGKISNALTSPHLELFQASTGDSALRWTETGSHSYIAGIDNSDSDKWKLCYGATGNAVLGTNDYITVSTAGVTTISSLALTGFTTGSVLFAGASGAISQNNAAFFWDNANTFQQNTSTAGKQLRLAYDSTHYMDLRAENGSGGFGMQFSFIPSGTQDGAFAQVKHYGSDFCFSYTGSSVNGFGVPNVTISGPPNTGTYTSASGPGFNLNNELESADNKLWSFGLVSKILSWRVINDANSSFQEWLSVTRSGITISSVGIVANSFVFTRSADTSKNLGLTVDSNGYTAFTPTGLRIGVNCTPIATLDVASTVRAIDRVRLSGADYGGVGSTSEADGPCFVNYVNTSGNRQACIADSALLASSATNPFFRFYVNGKIFDCISTNGTRLAFNIGGTNQIALNADGVSLNLGGSGGAVGFFSGSAGGQGTGGQNVTNNVTDSGSTAGTIPDITNGTVYATDYTNLRNALYQLARMLKQDHDQLRAMGILT